MKADKTVISLHADFDRLYAQVVQKSTQQGKTPTCSKNCPGCCIEPVYVHVKEIENALGRMTPAHRARVKVRTQEWLDRVLPSGLLSQEQPLVWLWRALGAVCPFLEGGLCSIYQDRPIGCRWHTAIGPREACYDEHLRREQKYIDCPELKEATAYLTVQRWSKLEMENLGVVLARILLHLDLESADHQLVQFVEGARTPPQVEKSLLGAPGA